MSSIEMLNVLCIFFSPWFVLVTAMAVQNPAGAPPFAAIAHTIVHPPHNWPFMKAFVEEKVRAAFDKTVQKRKHDVAKNPGCVVNTKLTSQSFNLVQCAIIYRDNSRAVEDCWRQTVQPSFKNISLAPSCVQHKQTAL